MPCPRRQREHGTMLHCAVLHCRLGSSALFLLIVACCQRPVRDCYALIFIFDSHVISSRVHAKSKHQVHHEEVKSRLQLDALEGLGKIYHLHSTSTFPLTTPRLRLVFWK
jgi:hypothetical protein